jgi:hypothetical protein
VYGKPQERLELRRPDEFDLTKLSLDELCEMRSRVLSEHPELVQFARASGPSPLEE